MILRIYNIRININFFFIVLVVLGFFAGIYQDVLAALIALGIHEIAHIYIGRQLGLEIEELELLPFGGRIKLILDGVSLESEMLTALAGPFANFGAVGLIVFLSAQKLITTKLARQLIHYQLMIGIFNMIPAIPLDGGRIFILWLRQYVSYTSSIKIASKTGKILAILLLIIAIIGLSFKRLLMSLFIASFFLFYQAVREEKDAQLVFMKYLAKKKEIMFKKKYLPGEIIVVIEDTPIKKILYQFTPQKYFIVFVLNQEMGIRKYLTETEIFDKVFEKGLDLKMIDLL